MKIAAGALLLTTVVLWGGPAEPTALQLTSGNTALLFGGTDAEGGIGDWYVSNGVVEAIIDNVGTAQDLVPLLGAGAPPIQSEINFTGGTFIDLGRVGENDDQLPQMFTVGGLSTSNFLLYDTIGAVGSDTIRVSGTILFPPTSTRQNPCLTVVTDYTAAGSNPFLTVTSTATNGCGANLANFGGFLDVFIWTLRGLIPFSGGGAPPPGGKGFNHPVLNLANPLLAVELPTFMAAPGLVVPADGIMDTANNTTSGEVSYGLLGVEVAVDPDGPGGSAPTVTPVDSLFGVSSTLVTALGNFPVSDGTPAGGTLTYTRRLYVGTHNDVRSAANGMIGALASRIPFSTGTISGNVDAADAANVEATILITRIGRCQANSSLSCKTNAACGSSGPCADPVPTPGQAVNSALSQVRTDAFGAFSGVVLPQGDYELRVSSAERDDVVVSPVVVGSGNTAVTIPPLSARGTVVFTVREKTKGTPLIPAKLTFKGVSPTLDPGFHKDLSATLGGQDILPETFGGTQSGTTGDAAGQGNVVYTASGSGGIQLRPGTYDVYASRGMEYSVARKQIQVASGGVATGDFELKRVVQTPNAVSADFHVHSGRSLDASAPLRDRVKAFAAEGVEVMVSSDHDKHVDYAPIISTLGLSSRMRSIIGNEMTGSVPNPPAFPNSIGHINAWPLPLNKDEARDGAIQDEFVAPNFVFKRLRDQGAEVIQYNHPRAGVSGLTSIGIFNNIGCNRCANSIDAPCNVDTDCPASPPPQDCTCVGYQPDRPISMAPNEILLDDGVQGPGSPANPDGLTNLDFDVMEVANGAKDSDFKALRQMRRDWLSLLSQGIFKPASGVSDSHRITVEHAGWARTYVVGVGDDPAALNVTAFDAQVRAGSMVVAAGPYIEFTVRPQKGAVGGLGQLVNGSPNGKVTLRIGVRSAAWVPVEEVRVIANGFVVAAFDSTTTPAVRPVPSDFQSTVDTVRFSAELSMTVAADTYFIVEAGPKIPSNINTRPVPPPIVDIIEPDVVPIAITNPIFVDRNGNGVFEPPGLPVMMAGNTLGEQPVLAGSGGIWERLWQGLGRLASRLRGEAVAEQAPGQMTGVSKEEKAEAIKKGEYFPLHEFSIPPDVVEQARRAAEAAQQATPQGGPKSPPGK